MMRNVAIFQNTVTGGGRTVVINEMIAALNHAGITPDLFVYRITPFHNLAQDLRYRVIRLRNPLSGLYNVKVSTLNLRMRHFAGKYDAVINSNNMLLFAPRGKHNFAYIHFPREMRIQSQWRHLPDNYVPNSALDKLDRLIFSGLFRLRTYPSGTKVAVNSLFSKEMLTRVYMLPDDAPIRIIYPPVKIYSEANSSYQKDNMVVSLGRYGPDKNQLFQIRVAEHFPETIFNITGFVSTRVSKIYFNKCCESVRSRGLKNVNLLTNIPLSNKLNLLKRAKIYLHTLAYEPFGISIVEALQFKCIPLIHNSGGQKEIIPVDELRYSDLDDAIVKLDQITDRSFSDFPVLESQWHKFSRNRFQFNFLNWINEHI